MVIPSFVLILPKPFPPPSPPSSIKCPAPYHYLWPYDLCACSLATPASAWHLIFIILCLCLVFLRDGLRLGCQRTAQVDRFCKWRAAPHKGKRVHLLLKPRHPIGILGMHQHRTVHLPVLQLLNAAAVLLHEDLIARKSLMVFYIHH